MTAVGLAVAAPATHCVWDPDLVEHVAVFAAERGDIDLAQTCSDVQAGLTDEELLHSIIREDADLTEWCQRERRYVTRGGRS